MRVFTAGNELNDYTADEFAAYGVADSPTFNQPGGAFTPQGNGGKYYFHLPASGWGLVKNFQTGNMVVPNGIRECYVRFHFHAGGRADGRWEILRFLDANYAVIFSLELQDHSSGSSYGGLFNLGFYQSNNTIIIHPGQYGFRNDFWHKIELYLKMGGSGGVVTLWVNDIQIWTATGAIVGPAAQTFFTLLAIYTTGITGGGMNFRAYDNIAVNAITDGLGNNIAGTVNTGRCGNGYVVGTLPARTGIFSQFTNDYGTSTNNFNHVNQLVTQNPTTFVGSNTPNTKDTYGFPRIPQEFRSVPIVKGVGFAVRNGTAITKAKMLLEPGYTAPVSAPTVTMAGGGSVDAGTHQWLITNVQSINPNDNESLPGPASGVITVVSGTQTANLTAIPLGPTGTAARRVFRTKAGGSTFFFVGQIPDNTTTVFTDALADASLGTANPPSELALPAGVGVGVTLPVGGYNYVTQQFESNPNNGNSPFTPNEINSIQAGAQFIA